MSEGSVELKPNMLSGAVQLIFDNYLNQRTEYTRKDMPHEFLVYGIVGIGFLGYFGINSYTSYSIPIYTLAIPPLIGFMLQVYFLYGELKHRSYLIHEDSVEIRDDFFDKESNSVRFENITDVELERRMVQRLFGTGNIMVNTAGKGSESQLVLKYLDNPEEYYQKLSDTINLREYNQELH